MMATLGGCGDGYELPYYRIKADQTPPVGALVRSLIQCPQTCKKTFRRNG
jgi:hypothetical protein